MKFLAKIRRKIHADLYELISQMFNKVLENNQLIGSEIHDHAENVKLQLYDHEEKLNQITEALVELQNQVRQMSVDSLEHYNKEENIVVSIDNINSAVTQMNTSVLSTLNGTLPYFPLLRSNAEEIVANVNSIYSFCLNELIQRQTNINETEIYQYYEKIHELTTCYKIIDDNVQKKRIGRQHDGGYVMIYPFSNIKIAYSIGICDDVSWDKEMANYGYSIFQYDHTIADLPEENEAFHWKKLGLTGLSETEELKRLETIIQDNAHESYTGMILKMDIEGYEWDLLCSCSQETLNQFDQIVMEIHNLNDTCCFDQIVKGLERLTASHAVVHVHGNNYRYAAFCGNWITPDVLEITLIKRDLYDLEMQDNGYMLKFDQVNRPKSQDIWMGKW